MKKKYCIFCGEEIKEETKKCKNCKKTINPKCLLLKEYIGDHLKDDIKCNIEDGILDFLKAWIVSHLYGIGITAAIIFTVTTIISKEITLSKYDTNIPKRNAPEIEIDICKNLDKAEKEEICPEEYTLNNHKCQKVENKDVRVYYTCDNNYTLRDGSCVSNFNIDYTAHPNECPKTLSGTSYESWGMVQNIMNAYESGGNCYIEYCDVAGTVLFDGNCPDTPKHEITGPATYNYTCDGYELDGTCRSYGEKYYHATCDEGELVEDHCEIKTEIEPTLECPIKYLYNSECNACVKEDA